MRISDWSSDVCSSDLSDMAAELLRFARSRNVTRIVLGRPRRRHWAAFFRENVAQRLLRKAEAFEVTIVSPTAEEEKGQRIGPEAGDVLGFRIAASHRQQNGRSEEHTSELQSLVRISYAVFCLQKKKHTTNNRMTTAHISADNIRTQT